ncbi:MAG: proton-conducting transporter membrane subunit [Proteobacteria bacterium]|nr:proton-conducting transporter membrane subunit [Pseudomonadota bacterium]
MISLETYIFITILPPLIVCLITPLLSKNENLRDALGPVGGIISSYGAIEIFTAVLEGKNISIKLLQIADGIFISFDVTPLGAIFGLVASVLWIFAAIYSVGYMRGNQEKNQTRFYTYYAIAVHAALCIAYSGDLLTLFIFYEVLTFSTYPLVTHKQNELALKAGRLYMSILVGSSVIFLLPAIIWVWILTGSLEMSKHGVLDGYLNYEHAPYLLAMFAFGIGKAALIPIHKWLPAAMVAPTPVSALLHAVAVVKAGVFTMLLVLTNVFGIDFLSKTGASIWLIWLASFTLLITSIIAVYKDDIKARLAYSTISQLSYITLGGALASATATQGAILHIVTHAAGKITLFFVAGAIYVGAKISKISELNGHGKSMSLMLLAFFIASLSIIGVPPMAGSWSKFFLMLGAAESGYLFVLIVFSISTILNAYYLMEIPARAFFLKKENEIKVKIPVLITIPTLCTCLLTIILFFAFEPFQNLTSIMVK